MTESRRYSIKKVNEMHKDAFISVFGSVFEDTTWAAIRAFEKLPFTSNNALKDIMCQLIEKSGEQAQLALLCAHPELGSKAKMADASVKEQSDAGIPASDDVIKEKMLKQLLLV